MGAVPATTQRDNASVLMVLRAAAAAALLARIHAVVTVAVSPTRIRTLSTPPTITPTTKCGTKRVPKFASVIVDTLVLTAILAFVLSATIPPVIVAELGRR